MADNEGRPSQASEQDESEDANTIGRLEEAADALERTLLGGGRTMRRREVAAGAGVSLLSARKLWRALGFPNLGDDEVAFTAADQEALTRIIDLVRTGKLSDSAAMSLTRALGQMTDRIVVWHIETMVEDLMARRNLSDAQARRELVELLGSLTQPLEETLVYAWRRQLASGVQRLAVRTQPGYGTEESITVVPQGSLPLARAVGFADLVSYTTLSRRMNERTLAQLVQRFENKCAEIISIGGGRLTKTIGDEVLFTAETPTAGAEISLSLAEAFMDDELLPRARVAVVWGRILSRLGDIFGPTVNLAARLTALAEPGTVVTDELTHRALAGDERFVFQTLKPQQVRGFGTLEPVLLGRGRGGGLVVD